MKWLPFAVLGIMLIAFLVPVGRNKRSDARSADDFERRMELLAYAEVHGTSGRWIVTPRKGVRFLGPRERHQARARARRRRVFIVLLEAIGLTLLIGVVPPLRASWFASGILAGLLLIYVWVLLMIKARVSAAPPATSATRERRRAEPRPVIESDQHVTVRSDQVAAAGA